MYGSRHGLFIVLAFVFWTAPLAADIWINEFHYDNIGGDVGEFIEIAVAPNMSSVSLTDITVTLYNGGDGGTYSGGSDLTGASSTTTNGFTFYTLPILGIQNGAPDGIYLAFPSGNQFLSYEGAFTATNGPANGLLSTDIGLSESSSTAVGSSLALTGTGSSYPDFSWTVDTIATPGAVNNNHQTVVPEPSALYLVGLMAAALVAYHKYGPRLARRR